MRQRGFRPEFRTLPTEPRIIRAKLRRLAHPSIRGQQQERIAEAVTRCNLTMSHDSYEVRALALALRSWSADATASNRPGLTA